MEKIKRITNKRFQRFLVELNQIIEAYKASSITSRVDWPKYEKEHSSRVRYVAAELNNIVNEASSLIVRDAHKRGRKPKLTPEKKATSVLIKSVTKLSNRNMSDLISLFGALDGTNVSYKTIERAYSDEIVREIIHNVFILTLMKKRIKDVDVTGDGTGYSLTITKHYRTQGNKEGGRNFVYSFNIMDLKT